MNRLSELREANRLRAFVGALILALAGVVSIALPYFIGLGSDTQAQENMRGILRDIGTALLVSGLLSAFFEYSGRSGFISEAKHSLEEVLTDREETLNQSRQAGIKHVHEDLPSDDLARRFRTAKTTIRILQTWMGNLQQIGEALCVAASNDCKIQILLLDPDSDQATYRSRDRGDEHEDAAEKHITSDLYQLWHYKKRPNTKNNIEIKLYKDATPVLSLYGYDDTIFVGTFWRNKSVIESPQLEISRQTINNQKPYFAVFVDDHFDDLWENRQCTRGRQRTWLIPEDPETLATPKPT